MGDRNGCMPVIDLQQFPDPAEYKKLREACEEWGCFRLLNHRIPLSLIADMKNVMRTLLDLPMEIKRSNKAEIPGSGFILPGVISSIYEGLGVHDLGSSQAVQEFCSKLDVPPNHRDIIDKYGQVVQDLAMDLGRKLVESIGLEYCDFFEGWLCQFRMNKYSFPAENIGTASGAQHTDSGFLTILHEDENVGVLQMMDKSGAFVPVKPWPGTIFVNLGDLAKVWSNGMLRNVEHRVVIKEGNTRVSMAVFLFPPSDTTTIEAPPELMDSNHPRLYVPVTYEELRKLKFLRKMRGGGVLELLRMQS